MSTRITTTCDSCGCELPGQDGARYAVTWGCVAGPNIGRGATADLCGYCVVAVKESMQPALPAPAAEETT